jgi:hypothetical protein
VSILVYYLNTMAALQRAFLRRSITQSPFPNFQMRGLTLDALNPNFHNVSYAVRGELAIKAEALRDELKDPSNKLPFDKVISSNIGNPQQLGLDQKPITFTRQVRTL